MLREDVEHERDQADRAERQVEVERQQVEEGRKCVDGLLIELADARTAAMISGCEAAVLRAQLPDGRAATPNGGEGGSAERGKVGPNGRHLGAKMATFPVPQDWRSLAFLRWRHSNHQKFPAASSGQFRRQTRKPLINNPYL
jgi:hypothetical protein